jgi:Na+/proline symporter
MTASNRDLLLILGIVVAIIISIATWYHSTSSQATLQIKAPISPKKNTSQVIKKLGQAFINLTRSGEYYW